MGPYFVTLASETDRPLRIPLLILGATLVLAWLASVAHKAWTNSQVRKGRKSQLEEWKEFARARGFDLDTRGKKLALRGTIAGRPFELDEGNFFTYGVDYENALRFRVEDVEGIFSINAWITEHPKSDPLPAVGDKDFNKRFRVDADEAGMRWIARFGPEELRLLVEFPDFIVCGGPGEVVIRMPYRLDLAHMDAARRLVESIWGPAPNATSRA